MNFVDKLVRKSCPECNFSGIKSFGYEILEKNNPSWNEVGHETICRCPECHVELEIINKATVSLLVLIPLVFYYFIHSYIFENFNSIHKGLIAWVVGIILLLPCWTYAAIKLELGKKDV